jgi:putative FmdB family regulatory protein
MPTYTYACKQCDHRFDQRQSFTDPALTVCPKCAGNLRKVLNSVGVVFKGSGFYRTDSRAGVTGPASKTAQTDKASQTGKSAPAAQPADSSKNAKAESGTPAASPSASDTAKKPAAAHA